MVKGENTLSHDAVPTYMTGLFIAKRVHGDKNIIWNADDVCDPCPISDPNDDNRTIAFDVTAWPNPSDTEYNLRLLTLDNRNQATIHVFDMSNKLVHSGVFNPDQVYSFGSKLEGGVYIVKINQAKNSKIIRLVKY